MKSAMAKCFSWRAAADAESEPRRGPGRMPGRSGAHFGFTFTPGYLRPIGARSRGEARRSHANTQKSGAAAARGQRRDAFEVAMVRGEP